MGAPPLAPAGSPAVCWPAALRPRRASAQLFFSCYVTAGLVATASVVGCSLLSTRLLDRSASRDRDLVKLTITSTPLIVPQPCQIALLFFFPLSLKYDAPRSRSAVGDGPRAERGSGTRNRDRVRVESVRFLPVPRTAMHMRRHVAAQAFRLAPGACRRGFATARRTELCAAPATLAADPTVHTRGGAELDFPREGRTTLFSVSSRGSSSVLGGAHMAEHGRAGAPAKGRVGVRAHAAPDVVGLARCGTACGDVANNGWLATAD